MRKIIKYLLFFVSYSPLFFYMGLTSLIIPQWKGKIIYTILDLFCSKSVLYFAISILSLIIFFVIMRSMRKTAPYTCNIVHIEEKNVEYLSYIMTYFIAFLDFKFDSIPSSLGIIFLFCFIAFVYAKSNLIYSNPVLALFGFNIYEAVLENNKRVMVISKSKNLSGKNIPLIKLASSIYLMR
jgi:hypothetical protein